MPKSKKIHRDGPNLLKFFPCIKKIPQTFPFCIQNVFHLKYKNSLSIPVEDSTYGGPEEPPGCDPQEGRRRQEREAHQAKKKQLKRQWKKIKDKQVSIVPSFIHITCTSVIELKMNFWIDSTVGRGSELQCCGAGAGRRKIKF